MAGARRLKLNPPTGAPRFAVFETWDSTSPFALDLHKTTGAKALINYSR